MVSLNDIRSPAHGSSLLAERMPMNRKQLREFIISKLAIRSKRAIRKRRHHSCSHIDTTNDNHVPITEVEDVPELLLGRIPQSRNQNNQSVRTPLQRLKKSHKVVSPCKGRVKFLDESGKTGLLKCAKHECVKKGTNVLYKGNLVRAGPGGSVHFANKDDYEGDFNGCSNPSSFYNRLGLDFTWHVVRSTTAFIWESRILIRWNHDLDDRSAYEYLIDSDLLEELPSHWVYTQGPRGRIDEFYGHQKALCEQLSRTITDVEFCVCEMLLNYDVGGNHVKHYDMMIGRPDFLEKIRRRSQKGRIKILDIEFGIELLAPNPFDSNRKPSTIDKLLEKVGPNKTDKAKQKVQGIAGRARSWRERRDQKLAPSPLAK